jgi:type IV pilus assembly protein PilX
MSVSAVRQRGVSLVVALILLLIMTLLGLAALRTTSLQEHMSANMIDRTAQFQAAESALREAEALIASGITVPSAGTCSNGICATPVSGAADRWLDASFGDASWRTSNGTGNRDAAITTRYIIEYMGDGAYGPDCNVSQSTESSDINCDMLRYRITARSTGAGRARVLLQTNFVTPK